MKLPVETKVVAGFSTTTAVAIVTQIIQYFWPHVALPPQSLMLLLAGSAGGIVAYFAPHTPAITEVENVVQQVIDKFTAGQPKAEPVNTVQTPVPPTTPLVVVTKPVVTSGGGVVSDSAAKSWGGSAS